MDSKAIGAHQDHWKGVWPSAQFLAGFFCANEGLVTDSVCLELGAGTGIVGLAVAKLDVKKVILTDFPGDEILSLLRENIEKNHLTNKCEVKGLDWQNAESIAAVLDSITELDFLIASDVFYDVCTFRPLIATISAFFDKFPKLRFYFSYGERESRPNIAISLLLVVTNYSVTRNHESFAIQSSFGAL
ncbi:unnamed protein product [Strongylus vulgaris]|uniref:Methyltransferase small domain-containing protein n=1 Tax=Strongylus vulgaris TaxID=40348 RepID=A0A3P7LCK3_STRVU|nr:unnamed protein product [Strongylus vulgaris]